MEFLVNIVGGVALLLWGVRMVRTGVLRGFGAELRQAVSRYAHRTLFAFLSGIGITGLLQSSSATALIVSSLAAREVVPGATALAILLGADIGTTLVVQLFSQRLDWLSPLLLAIGVFGFMFSRRSRPRNLARASIGLGLLLLALQLIGMTSEPLRASGTMAFVLHHLADEPVIAILLVAMLTYLAHSSVAIVLLIASLASAGVVEPALSLVMVLGANLGGAVLPVIATLDAPQKGRRAPLGNFGVRLIGVLIFAPLVSIMLPWFQDVNSLPAALVANFHTGFNVAIALVALPLVGLIDTLCARVLPEETAEEDPTLPRHLESGALNVPAVALACASREALRIGDNVQTMLDQAIEVFRTNDDVLRKSVERDDDVIDRLYEATKLYLAQLNSEELDPEEGERSIEILSFTTNLEHIGDIIDKNLMELAAKKIKAKTNFSKPGMKEIETFHARVKANLDLALNIFISGNLEMARRLLMEKTEIRDLEMHLIENHMQRIGEGRPETIDTSSLHLDVLRDLKRINSHVTSVAYPILERAGELADSRLINGDMSQATGEH